MKYQIRTKKIAGGRMVTVGTTDTIKEARKIAKEYDAKYLTYQDVRIEYEDGSLKEYSGPMR